MVGASKLSGVSFFTVRPFLARPSKSERATMHAFTNERGRVITPCNVRGRTRYRRVYVLRVTVGQL